MSTFISALRNGAKLLERRDDDGFDRLSNRYSVGILVMLAMFISTKSYVGDPIDCYVPKEFTGQWTKYTDNYCWIANTYYVPISADLKPTIPPAGLFPGDKTKYANELNYYQWVPIILTFCAGLFAIPAQIWAWASNAGGYDVEAIVKATKGSSNVNPETRDKTILYLVNQMDRMLGYRRPNSSRGMKSSSGVGKRHGRFLFFMYIIVKILYCINAICLIFVLDAFLGNSYHSYGVDVLQGLENPDFHGSTRFPYITYCDFDIRGLGEVKRRYTVQCVLPVNLFNEKVFVALWFWLVFVSIASIIGLVLWLFTATAAVNRTFAKKYLTIMGRLNKSDSDQEVIITEFLGDYLRLDGVFVMRLILKNTNDAVGGEIMAALWDRYTEKRKPRFDSTTETMLPDRHADEAV